MTKRFRTSLTLPDGTRKYICGKTQEDMENKLNQLKLELGVGIDVGDAQTVQQFAQMWINVYKRPVLKSNSLATLLGILNNYIMPEIGSMKVREVKPIHIQMLMSKLVNYSQSTQSKTLKALRAIFDTAVDNGIIIRSPVTSNIRTRAKTTEEKVPLTPEQTKKLLDAMKGKKVETLIRLMLQAGLRREEACGLMWSDVDFRAHTLTVNRVNVFFSCKNEIRDELKSPAAHRTIPMTVELEDYLYAERRKSISEWVCCTAEGDPLSAGAFRFQWRYIDKAEKEGILDFHTHPHLLRHTCITRWAASGLFDLKTVQYLAGHSTPTMTLNVYAHYEKETRLNDTIEKMRSA